MGGSAEVNSDGDTLWVTSGGGRLYTGINAAPHVVEESNEIADQFGFPCRGCAVRFEMAGDDPDMELFNDYLLINERMQSTGRFVIFDSQECELLFEDPS